MYTAVEVMLFWLWKGELISGCFYNEYNAVPTTLLKVREKSRVGLSHSEKEHSKGRMPYVIHHLFSILSYISTRSLFHILYLLFHQHLEDRRETEKVFHLSNFLAPRLKELFLLCRKMDKNERGRLAEKFGACLLRRKSFVSIPKFCVCRQHYSSNSFFFSFRYFALP